MASPPIPLSTGGGGGKGRALPVGEGPGVRVIASGGVGTLEHLRQLRDAGAAGAIVGRALYSGALDLATAIRAVQQENQGQRQQENQGQREGWTS